MTAKIFSKDLRLAAHPMMYVFALFGVMLINVLPLATFLAALFSANS